MNCTNRVSQWFPWTLLHPDTIEKYALLILNTPIFWKSDFLLPFWSKASIRVLVDGGANQWLKWVESEKIQCDQRLKLPNLVTGDMDSINKVALTNFQHIDDVEVVFTPDQNETDFTKALREIKTYSSKQNIPVKNVVAIVGNDGRLDHIMANVQTLFHARDLVPEYNVFILGSDSLSWLLEPGKHKICVPEQLRSTWCALIPVGKKCESITTTGLKWNLSNGSLCFGGMVSTSNTYSGEDVVTIKTSDVVLWSMGLVNVPTNLGNT